MLVFGRIDAVSDSVHCHIPSRTDYRKYIAPMNMLSCMFIGFQYHTRLAVQRDVKRLRELITEQIAEKYILSLPSSTDGYILRFFHHFCINVKEVMINMDWMRTDVWKSKKGEWFGYKMFRPLFFENEKDNSLKLQYFLQFLPNLKEFVVIYQESKTYLPSILVDEDIIHSVAELAKYINTHKSLRLSFERIIVVNPIMTNGWNIGTLVGKYDSMFQEIGWTVEEMVYSKSERPGKGPAVCFKRT